MTGPSRSLTSHVKTFRTAKGLTQSQLADQVGVKRQAIYDIESGKYAPNTAVALRLAKVFDCRVEDLFSEEGDEERDYTLIGRPEGNNPRVSLAMLRGRLLAYPLAGTEPFSSGFEAADGLLTPDQNRVRLLSPSDRIDQSIVLLGCDPAFALLGQHASRLAASTRVHCRFASSVKAIRRLAQGHAHIAGTHLHSGDRDDANILLAKQSLGRQQAIIVGFSRIEEGLLVAKGNPLAIRRLEDLTNPAVRLINREPGAALRALLDELLLRQGVPAAAIAGYEDTVTNHAEGAQSVLHGKASAALGFRAVADLHGLDFVPLESARCELVVPKDILDHPAMRILLDSLQTRQLRSDITALAGYEAESTGSIITEL